MAQLHPHGSTVLVTGASSGIGKSIASLLAKNGFTVYGTSRKERPAEDGVSMLRLDVTDSASIEQAVKRIETESGGVDILVNCAGSGIAGSVEDVSYEEAKGQFEANFFGAIEVIRAVLPGMRAKKHGLIVNISSVASVLPIPFQSTYSASKAALNAVSDSLLNELRPFGIRVVTVMPGDTKTGFTDARVYSSASKSSDYAETTTHAVGVMEHDERNGKPPETVAKAVLRAATRRRPSIFVTVGFDYAALVFLNRLLPKRFVLFLISLIYCKKN